MNLPTPPIGGSGGARQMGIKILKFTAWTTVALAVIGVVGAVVDRFTAGAATMARFKYNEMLGKIIGVASSKATKTSMTIDTAQGPMEISNVNNF